MKLKGKHSSSLSRGFLIGVSEKRPQQVLTRFQWNELFQEDTGVVLCFSCFLVAVTMIDGGGLITTYLCRRVFLQEIFSLSTVSRASSCCVWNEGFSLAWQPLSSCWSKTHLTADTVTFPPAASNPLQTCFLCFFFFGWFLTILTSFLSAAGDSLCFLPDHCSDTIRKYVSFILYESRSIWLGNIDYTDDQMSQTCLCRFESSGNLTWNLCKKKPRGQSKRDLMHVSNALN